MNTDEHGLKHAEITGQILGLFFEVYNELGPGFLESVYVEALALALHQAGLAVEREIALTVYFRDRIVGRFRADLIVGRTVLLEVKACTRLQSIHEAQVLNYLRATALEVGLLLNFGRRPQFKRLLFDNPRKGHRSSSGSLAEKQSAIIHPCASVFIRGLPVEPSDRVIEP